MHKVLGYGIKINVNYTDLYYVQFEDDFGLVCNLAKATMFANYEAVMATVAAYRFSPNGPGGVSEVLQKASDLTKEKHFKAQISVFPVTKGKAVFKETMTVSL